ncbi:hypothetical protein [Methylobacterium sp. J-070]|uniref:hypothetical protein n=1 Tax=Methylobacterium sp. J-070 TaxID=2836650 RepID=UPI001FBA6D9D|nr:hypothetical protein [Methylobacterium sp. J-070]MCJ2052622.1 hypothetical protein [Methylobacterium sp. J-070]
MPLNQLIAPIAAATIVTAFWLAAMWRGHQHERGGKRLPWPYEAGLVGYILAVGAFVYFRASLPSTRAFDLFGIAVAAEGLGIVITYALLQAFVLSRGRPWSERATPMFFAIVLTTGVIGAIFTA